MNTNIKAYELFWNLYNNNPNFKKIINDNMKNKKIRFFNDEEWNKISNQNFAIPNSTISSFLDYFIHGYNIGDCVGTSYQLSYSYDNIDIVSGILPILKGTLNAKLEGGHRWLETKTSIIDTSLMLVIDKSLKSKFGYLEEERLTYKQLLTFHNYQIRKEFINDQKIKKIR